MEEKLKHSSPKYVREQFPNIVLVGLGPFAKRHYFGFFDKYHFFPKLIVELDTKEKEVEEFCLSYSISIPIFTIANKNRDGSDLPIDKEKKLLSILAYHKITHAILCTEPKAHMAYLHFFVRYQIHVLVEKPLSAHVNSSFSLEAATKIEKEYDTLLHKVKNTTRIDIQCQRRYHPIYQFIFKQIEQFVTEFDIPITYCDIYHSDGMWNMPDEFLFRENHPYKYGYGKLLHSGYHFLDLFSSLLKACFTVCSKEPDEIELYAVPFSPIDSLAMFNHHDYAQFFQEKKYTSICENPESYGFPQFGELDFHAILQVLSKKKRLMTSSLNLLQTGFSRRSSNKLPIDTYKSNGRIRHERINLQFGPLLNIQVHSYLSEESKKSKSVKMGESRHFDVAIFRNSNLIGGKAFEFFDGSFFSSNLEKSMNEISREECLINFLLGKPSKSSLKDHKLGIKLLSNSLKALCRKNNTENVISRFSLSAEDFI